MDAANGLALVVDRVKADHLLQELVQLGVRRRVQRDLVERLEQVWRRAQTPRRSRARWVSFGARTSQLGTGRVRNVLRRISSKQLMEPELL